VVHEQVVKEKVTKDPVGSNQFKEKGNEKFKLANYEEAISLYTKSIELDQSNTASLINRSMAYLKTKRFFSFFLSFFLYIKIYNIHIIRFSEAEADCSTTLKLEENNVKAWWRRAIARREQGKLTDALNGKAFTLYSFFLYSLSIILFFLFILF
jgi:tetratricopeptide (TPR) repeat protein